MDLQAKKEQMDALVAQLQQLREMQLGKGTDILECIMCIYKLMCSFMYV